MEKNLTPQFKRHLNLKNSKKVITPDSMTYQSFQFVAIFNGRTVTLFFHH